MTLGRLKIAVAGAGANPCLPHWPAGTPRARLRAASPSPRAVPHSAMPGARDRHHGRRDDRAGRSLHAADVPAGPVELQVLHVGYTSQKKRVVVTDGSTTNADFAIEVAVAQLEEIVTTATGQQRRVELGNALSTLGDVGKRVEQSAINTISDLMVGKAAGRPGAPPDHDGRRADGANSRPVVDQPDQRADLDRGWDSIRGRYDEPQRPDARSPCSNSLSPEEIEDVEIVKGPRRRHYTEQTRPMASSW